MHYVQAKGILSAGNGMNLYRGCTHGCIYCDSRSRCYHMDHAFEDIEVKENALTLLEDALRRKRSACMLGTGAMTDPYIPLESELGYVRGALSLALRYAFGFTLQTKSDRVLRDIDLLQAINERTKSVVQMTLTTYDEALCRKLEPNVCTTSARFAALQKLREGNREYFFAQLDRVFPGMKEQYIRTFGLSYENTSPRNAELMRLYHAFCEEHGMMHDNAEIFTYLRTFTEKSDETQLCLF